MILLDTKVGIARVNGRSALVRLSYKDAIAANETVAVPSVLAQSKASGASGILIGKTEHNQDVG